MTSTQGVTIPDMTTEEQYLNTREVSVSLTQGELQALTAFEITVGTLTPELRAYAAAMIPEPIATSLRIVSAKLGIVLLEEFDIDIEGREEKMQLFRERLEEGIANRERLAAEYRSV